MVEVESFECMDAALVHSRPKSTISETPSRPSAQGTSIPSKKRKKKTVDYNDDTDDDAESQLMARCMKILSNEEKEKDPCDAFGEYVASQLKRYRNDDILRIQTENAIQKVLIDASEKFLTKNFVIMNYDGSMSPFGSSIAATSFDDNRSTLTITEQIVLQPPNPTANEKKNEDEGEGEVEVVPACSQQIAKPNETIPNVPNEMSEFLNFSSNL